MTEKMGKEVHIGEPIPNLEVFYCLMYPDNTFKRFNRAFYIDETLNFNQIRSTLLSYLTLIYEEETFYDIHISNFFFLD